MICFDAVRFRNRRYSPDKVKDTVKFALDVKAVGVSALSSMNFTVKRPRIILRAFYFVF